MAGTKQIGATRVALLRLDRVEAEKAAEGLRALGMAQVLTAASTAELSVHIADGKVDVVVVAETDMPADLVDPAAGRALPPPAAVAAGIPCLILLSSLTRNAGQAARAAGFAAALAADAAPRTVYRRIGGLMQRLRRFGRAPSSADGSTA